MQQGFGLISVFTGDGRGKSTAALGTVVRAVGAGKRAAIVYFDKGGEHYSERAALETLGVSWQATGRDRIDPVSGRFDFSITEEDKAEALRGLWIVEELFEKGLEDLVVLDEINSTTTLGMISEEEVLRVLAKKPEHTEVILTGRNAPASFLTAGHLITEMVLKEHYFYSGVKARKGIDY